MADVATSRNNIVIKAVHIAGKQCPWPISYLCQNKLYRRNGRWTRNLQCGVPGYTVWIHGGGCTLTCNPPPINPTSKFFWRSRKRIWSAQNWFPDILNLLVAPLVKLSIYDRLLTLKLSQFDFHAWRLSNNSCERRGFLSELPRGSQRSRDHQLSTVNHQVLG